MRLKLSSFLQMKPNLLIYQVLGWKIAFYYILVLGRFYFAIKRREKRRIELSIKAAFGHSKDKREIASITRDVFRGVFSHYYEKLFNAYADVRTLKGFFDRFVDSPTLGKVDKALSRGKGVLFVTGHYGGIEYIPIYLAVRGYPISVIAKFATPQLKETLRRRTEPFGLRIIDASQKNSILTTVLKELRSNRIVFIECDEIEEWKSSDKQRIFFLGSRVGLDRTINILQKRSQAEVIFGVLRRISLREYALSLDHYEDMASRFGEAAISFGEAVLKDLENLILSDPTQWYQWKNFFDIAFAEPVNSKDKVEPVQAFRPAYA
jgi:KDO2-lipid IV(A) lauroyltransferase